MADSGWIPFAPATGTALLLNGWNDPTRVPTVSDGTAAYWPKVQHDFQHEPLTLHNIAYGLPLRAVLLDRHLRQLRDDQASDHQPQRRVVFSGLNAD